MEILFFTAAMLMFDIMVAGMYHILNKIDCECRRGNTSSLLYLLERYFYGET